MLSEILDSLMEVQSLSKYLIRSKQNTRWTSGCSSTCRSWCPSPRRMAVAAPRPGGRPSTLRGARTRSWSPWPPGRTPSASCTGYCSYKFANIFSELLKYFLSNSQIFFPNYEIFFPNYEIFLFYFSPQGQGQPQVREVCEQQAAGALSRPRPHLLRVIVGIYFCRHYWFYFFWSYQEPLCEWENAIGDLRHRV